MSEIGSNASIVSAAEQPTRRGILGLFSSKELVLLLAALAVAVVGISAAALTPGHSPASASASPSKSPIVSVVATGAATSATPATAAPTAVRVATVPVTTTAATTTASTATTTTTTTTSTTSETKTTKPKAKKKTTKKTVATTVPAPKVSFTVGSEVDFGTYANAPLRWRVLDINNTSILLLSKYILSAGAFQSNWEGQNASLYSASEVRTWLRGTFATKAFNTTETASLLSHVGGAAAGDRVFLLNAAEVKHYFPKAADRRAAPTAAAASDTEGISGSGLTLTGPYASWWLADAASDEYTAQTVDPAGKFGSQLVYYADLGVRPAILVERDKIGFTLNAGN